MRGLRLAVLFLTLAASARALPEATDALTGLADLSARCFELRAGWERVQAHYEAAVRQVEALQASPEGWSTTARLRLEELGTRAGRQAWSLRRAGDELGVLEARLRWLRRRYPGPQMERAAGQVLGMHLRHVRHRLERVEEARRVARREARALAPEMAQVLSPP